MLKRTLIIFCTTFGLTLMLASDGYAQRRPKPVQKHKVVAKKPTPKNPVLPKAAHNKAVGQFRAVRNNLARDRKFSAQTHASATRSLQRARETERAQKDVHDFAKAAYRRAPMGSKNADIAKRSQLYEKQKTATRNLQTATANRANAEATFSQTRAGLKEASRQVSAANRTLSLAKKGDWMNARRVVGRAKPLKPATRPRKVSYNFTPQGPTPIGTGVRKGILKTSPRK
jgi:hypothetical protein